MATALEVELTPVEGERHAAALRSLAGRLRRDAATLREPIYRYEQALEPVPDWILMAMEAEPV